MSLFQPLSAKRLRELETRTQVKSRYWGYGKMLYDTFKEGMQEMGFVEVSENTSLYSPVDSFLRKDKDQHPARYTAWVHPANIVVFSHSYVSGGYTTAQGEEPLTETVSSVDWNFQFNAGYSANAYSKYYRLNVGTVNTESPLTGERVVDVHGSQTQGSHLADLNVVLTKLLGLKKKLLPFDKWCRSHFYMTNNLFYDFQPKPEWEGLNKDALMVEVDKELDQQRQAYFERIKLTFPALALLMEEESSKYSRAKGVHNLNAVESLEHYFQEAKSTSFPESKKASFLKLVQLILEAGKTEGGVVDFSAVSSKPIYKNIGMAQLLLFFEPQYLMPYLQSLPALDAQALLTTPNETGRTFALQVLHQMLFENPFMFRAKTANKHPRKQVPAQAFLSDFIEWGRGVLGKEAFSQTLATPTHSWSGEILASIAYGDHTLIEDRDVAQHVVEVLHQAFPAHETSLPMDISYSRRERTERKLIFTQETLNLDDLEKSAVWRQAKDVLDKQDLSDTILWPLQTLLTQHRYQQTFETPQTSSSLRTARL